MTGFDVSPDGSKVAFSHQPNPLINIFSKSSISIVDLASKKISELVSNPSSDGLETWSPDSKQLLYSSNLADTTSNFYMNSKLFAINVADKSVKQLAKDLDEDLSIPLLNGSTKVVWSGVKMLFCLQAKSQMPGNKSQQQFAITCIHIVFCKRSFKIWLRMQPYM